MIKNIAVVGNAVVFLWMSFMLITKGISKNPTDILLILLVYVTIISSLMTITGINPFKKK